MALRSMARRAPGAGFGGSVLLNDLSAGKDAGKREGLWGKGNAFEVGQAGSLEDTQVKIQRIRALEILV